MNFIISAETVNFSSDRVWTFLLQIGILAILGVAAMALKTEKSKRKFLRQKQQKAAQSWQVLICCKQQSDLLFHCLCIFLADYFYAAGLILSMGFGQSIGSALSWGSNYETNYGFEGGASFGLPVASIGFIVGSGVIGVI